jgi:DNA repair exonuclease SbcCD nuclease subunit
MKAKDKFSFIATGDTHFGLSTFGVEDPVTRINSRSLDGFQGFDQLIDYAIKNKIKLITHSGDVFDSKTASQTVVAEFYKRVKKISDNGIDLVILSGNHDKSRLKQVKCSLDLANIIDIPGVKVSDGSDLFDLGYIQIATISYYMPNEELENQLESFAEQIDWNRPTLLLAHLQIETDDFKYSSFKEDLHFTPLTMLTRYPYNFISVGHLHKPYILSEKPRAMYNGSLVRCSFTEENDEKAFSVITIENNEIESVERISINCLKMITLKGTMSQIVSATEIHKTEKFKDTIIRCIIDDSEETIDEKYFKEKFKFCFKYIIKKEPKKNKIIRDKEMNLSSLNIAVQDYFKDDKDKDDILQIMEEIKNMEKIER